jgi:hypothetical protein
MILEVLAPVTEKHIEARRLLEKWKLELAQKLESETDPEARDALEALNRELDFRQETSIRRRVRRLVLDTFQAEPDAGATYERDAVEVYDARGTLAHESQLDPQDLAMLNQTALRLVQRLLAHKLGVPKLFELSLASA